MRLIEPCMAHFEVLLIRSLSSIPMPWTTNASLSSPVNVAEWSVFSFIILFYIKFRFWFLGSINRSGKCLRKYINKSWLLFLFDVGWLANWRLMFDLKIRVIVEAIIYLRFFCCFGLVCSAMVSLGWLVVVIETLERDTLNWGHIDEASLGIKLVFTDQSCGLLNLRCLLWFLHSLRLMN